jgi:hypothetical protein
MRVGATRATQDGRGKADGVQRIKRYGSVPAPL